MGFRLQQKSMILNDLERGHNGWLLSVVLISCFKRNIIPLQVGSYTDSQHIANCFKENCCFDSYKDTKLVSELNRKVSTAGDDTNIHNAIFNGTDIEKALSKLKIGNAPGIDRIVKEHLHCVRKKSKPLDNIE